MRLLSTLRRSFSQSTSLPVECEKFIESNFFCLKCETSIETPNLAKMSPFQLFHIDQEYAIDRDHIGKAFKTYQMKLHPDRLVSASEKFVSDSQSLLLRINHDYRLLLDDVARSFLLVRIRCRGGWEHCRKWI